MQRNQSNDEEVTRLINDLNEKIDSFAVQNWPILKEIMLRNMRVLAAFKIILMLANSDLFKQLMANEHVAIVNKERLILDPNCEKFDSITNVIFDLIKNILSEDKEINLDISDNDLNNNSSNSNKNSNNNSNNETKFSVVDMLIENFEKFLDQYLPQLISYEDINSLYNNGKKSSKFPAEMLNFMEKFRIAVFYDRRLLYAENPPTEKSLFYWQAFNNVMPLNPEEKTTLVQILNMNEKYLNSNQKMLKFQILHSENFKNAIITLHIQSPKSYNFSDFLKLPSNLSENAFNIVIKTPETLTSVNDSMNKPRNKRFFRDFSNFIKVLQSEIKEFVEFQSQEEKKEEIKTPVEFQSKFILQSKLPKEEEIKNAVEIFFENTLTQIRNKCNIPFEKLRFEYQVKEIIEAAEGNGKDITKQSLTSFLQFVISIDKKSNAHFSIDHIELYNAIELAILSAEGDFKIVHDVLNVKNLLTNDEKTNLFNRLSLKGKICQITEGKCPDFLNFKKINGHIIYPIKREIKKDSETHSKKYDVFFDPLCNGEFNDYLSDKNIGFFKQAIFEKLSYYTTEDKKEIIIEIAISKNLSENFKQQIINQYCKLTETSEINFKNELDKIKKLESCTSEEQKKIIPELVVSKNLTKYNKEKIIQPYFESLKINFEKELHWIENLRIEFFRSEEKILIMYKILESPNLNEIAKGIIIQEFLESEKDIFTQILFPSEKLLLLDNLNKFIDTISAYIPSINDLSSSSNLDEKIEVMYNILNEQCLQKSFKRKMVTEIYKFSSNEFTQKLEPNKFIEIVVLGYLPINETVLKVFLYKIYTSYKDNLNQLDDFLTSIRNNPSKDDFFNAVFSNINIKSLIDACNDISNIKNLEDKKLSLIENYIYNIAKVSFDSTKIQIQDRQNEAPEL